jgi:hypothetical protein
MSDVSEKGKQSEEVLMTALWRGSEVPAVLGLVAILFLSACSPPAPTIAPLPPLTCNPIPTVTVGANESPGATIVATNNGSSLSTASPVSAPDTVTPNLGQPIQAVAIQGGWASSTTNSGNYSCNPINYTTLTVTIQTANNSNQSNNDIATSQAEVVAQMAGQSAPFCLKPSNAGTDNWGPNGSSACPKEDNAPQWNNLFTTAPISFSLSPPVPFTTGQFGTLSISLIQHPRGLQGYDTWDMAGISVSATDSAGHSVTLLALGSLALNNVGNSPPPTANPCVAEFAAHVQPLGQTVTFQLSSTDGKNPTGH